MAAPLLALLSLAAVASSQEHCGNHSPSHLSGFHEPTCPTVDARVESGPASWSPWTHRPLCAGTSNFCAYTNAAVAQGRGVSVVTTADHAAGALSILEHAWDRPFPDAKRVLPHRAWALRHIPGKGTGLVATERIPRDRVILIDHAAVIVPAQTPEGIPRRDKQALFRAAFEQLGRPGMVLGLSQKGVPGASLEEDILNNNAFGLALDAGDYAGLFPEVAVSGPVVSKKGVQRY
jgi:hypothetical protein